MIEHHLKTRSPVMIQLLDLFTVYLNKFYEKLGINLRVTSILGGSIFYYEKRSDFEGFVTLLMDVIKRTYLVFINDISKDDFDDAGIMDVNLIVKHTDDSLSIEDTIAYIMRSFEQVIKSLAKKGMQIGTVQQSGSHSVNVRFKYANAVGKAIKESNETIL